MNKKNLFIIISILLGFIISLYYNKNFNKKFILSFILVSIIIFVIFYFLGDIHKNKETFYTKIYNSIDEHDKEESNYKKNKNIQDEEEKEIIFEEQEIIKKIEEKKMDNPDISNYTLNTPIPLSGMYGPLNINISYNAQNSINELDNGTTSSSLKGTMPNSTSTQPNSTQSSSTQPNSTQSTSTQPNPSNNLSNQSRVYTNSDWIYGTNAWTNNPDYYIPQQGCSGPYGDNNCPIKQVPKALNEIVTTRSYKQNKSVAPLMINTPWAEYKSGDDVDDIDSENL